MPIGCDSVLIMGRQIRKDAQNLWNAALQPNDRILITGANGWFGRTALAMMQTSKLPILATGSKRSMLQVDNLDFLIEKQDMSIIESFQPTVVIDGAFLTREKLSEVGHDKYVFTNQKLIEDSISIVKQASVRKYLGFSSGATVHLAGQKDFSLEGNPYGALKRDFETRVSHLSGELGADITIARVWSVTGSYNTKPGSFAISDLVRQARAGGMSIRASNSVFRRYCAIEDVLAIGLQNNDPISPVIFDTGGELVELQELAELVRNIVNPDARISREFDEGLKADSYHSDGIQWDSLVNESDLTTDSLQSQVMRMAEFLD
jgi:nucleoside-diphosphate-sugar epimerase